MERTKHSITLKFNRQCSYTAICLLASKGTTSSSWLCNKIWHFH